MWLASCPHTFDGYRSRLPQTTIPVCLEVIGVKGNLIVRVGFQAENFGRDVLQRIQHLTVTRRQHWRVRAGELDIECAWAIRS